MPFAQKLLVVWLVLFSSWVNVYAQTTSRKDNLRIIIGKAKQDITNLCTLIQNRKILLNHIVDSATQYSKRGSDLLKSEPLCSQFYLKNFSHEYFELFPPYP
jgi:hypothetical protein